MDKFNRCVECKQVGLVITQQEETWTIAGHTFRANLEMLACPACGESYCSAETLQRFEMQIATWFAQHGVNHGGALRLMRSVLGLKGVELAGLLDVAPETLSRWEKEHRPPDRKATALLASMVLDRAEGHDRTLQRLRFLQEPPPAENFVDLTLAPVPA